MVSKKLTSAGNRLTETGRAMTGLQTQVIIATKLHEACGPETKCQQKGITVPNMEVLNTGDHTTEVHTTVGDASIRPRVFADLDEADPSRFAESFRLYCTRS